MENLNAEQVKKALECCSSSDDVSACESGCPYWCGDYDTCPCIEEPNFIVKNALALITSQEQRIKELTTENVQFRDEQGKLTEENERLRAENGKAKLWENVLKAEAQEVPIKAETIRVANAITDEIYIRYRLGECFDQECHWTPFNSDKFKAIIEDVRAKYIPEEKWEDRDC